MGRGVGRVISCEMMLNPLISNDMLFLRLSLLGYS